MKRTKIKTFCYRMWYTDTENGALKKKVISGKFDNAYVSDKMFYSSLRYIMPNDTYNTSL